MWTSVSTGKGSYVRILRTFQHSLPRLYVSGYLGEVLECDYVSWQIGGKIKLYRDLSFYQLGLCDKECGFKMQYSQTGFLVLIATTSLRISYCWTCKQTIVIPFLESLGKGQEANQLGIYVSAFWNHSLRYSQNWSSKFMQQIWFVRTAL